MQWQLILLLQVRSCNQLNERFRRHIPWHAPVLNRYLARRIGQDLPYMCMALHLFRASTQQQPMYRARQKMRYRLFLQ